jgi:hypothetical protein
MTQMDSRYTISAPWLLHKELKYRGVTHSYQNQGSKWVLHMYDIARALPTPTVPLTRKGVACAGRKRNCGKKKKKSEGALTLMINLAHLIVYTYASPCYSGQLNQQDSNKKAQHEPHQFEAGP